MIETSLDVVTFGLLGAAVILSLPIVLNGNGHRPLAIFVIAMTLIWTWASIEGFFSEQDATQHARRLLSGLLCFVVPIWVGGKHR